MIYHINKKEASDMLMLLNDSDYPGVLMPHEQFYWFEDGKWIACDNEDGFAWIEEFSLRREAINWLQNDGTYDLDLYRQGCRELLDEGYGFSGVRVYLNDLARSGDITWDENKQLMHELIDSGIDCSIATI